MFSKISLATAVVSAGKCPFGFDNDTVTNPHPMVKSSVSYPSEIFTCPGNSGGLGIATTTNAFNKDKYKAIVAEVVAQYDAVDAAVGDNSNPRGKYAGCLVRAAGHDFMDFRYGSNGSTSDGSDGCINFADEDNTGLASCLTNSGLPSIFQNHCTTVSLADFLIIAAEAVMGRTAEKYNPNDPYRKGTAAYAFMENFKSGRTAVHTCPSNTGLMPNPELGCDGLSSIFINHIYNAQGNRAWELTAAISGAHTLGSASIANSGYNGFWGAAHQAHRFNNDYYKSILMKGWYQEKAVNGNSAKN